MVRQSGGVDRETEGGTPGASVALRPVCELEPFPAELHDDEMSVRAGKTVQGRAAQRATATRLAVGSVLAPPREHTVVR